MKSQNRVCNQNVQCPDNADSMSKAAYERDDGYPTDEQLEAIKKLVRQKDFNGAESLFD